MFFIKGTREYKQIAGLKELSLDSQSDERGEIWPIYSDNDFLPPFKEDKISISNRFVLRGLHGDPTTGKLITCISGEIQLAVADLRKNSSTYGNSLMFHLSDREPKSIFVPAGCVNGHLCLSEKCVFYYKWSEKYSGASTQKTIKWNDERFNLPWLCKDPILSDRDKLGKSSEGVYL